MLSIILHDIVQVEILLFNYNDKTSFKNLETHDTNLKGCHMI